MEVDLVSDENDYDSYDETQFDDDNGERASSSVHPDSAPRYTIPERVIGAVEIPAVVNNPDRAVKTFGRHPHLQHVRIHPFNLTLLTITASGHWKEFSSILYNT